MGSYISTTQKVFNRCIINGLLLIGLAMTSCSKKSDNNNGGTSTTNTASDTVWASNYSATCSSGTSAIGMIYDDGSVGNFQGQVMGYVSSWMNPNDLGTVSGSSTSTGTGIDFKGKLNFSSSGQVVTGTSGLVIKITDSKMADGSASALATANYVGKAVSGSVNVYTRSFSVIFQDSYGYVQIQGTYDGTYATGYVSYQNLKATSGFSPQSGVLGKFKIAQCGLL